MASLIRSPRLSSTSRLLQTPRRWSETDADLSVPQPDRVEPQPPDAGEKVDAAALRADLTAATERADALTRELGTLREDLERTRAEAVERGLREGRDAGERAVRAEFEAQRDQIAACLAALQARLGERLAHEEDAIAEAVLGAIAKLLGDTLVTPEGAAAAVRSVCEHIELRDSLRVRVSPRDHALLCGEPELLRPLPTTVRLEPDPSIEIGGCIVDVEGQTLDGRLELQLEKLRATMTRIRASLGEDEQ